MSMKLIAAGAILLIFLFGLVQSLRIGVLEKDLSNTKKNLYDCRAENKDMHETFDELKKKSEQVQLNLAKAQKINSKSHNDAQHQVSRIITTPTYSDCESTYSWSASESSRIAQEFNNQSIDY